jgi:Ni/Fe-hydrogenase 1 B-type cytochrome subunit
VNAMAIARSKTTDVERLYIWELPVRLTHWLIFFSVIVLSATGYYIGHPFINVSGPARDHFVMGTMRVVHLYAAIVFALSVLVRIYWMFAGNVYAALTQLIPLRRERFRSFWEAAMFYSFMRREPEECAGHNALAGSSYAMIYGVYLLMTATGLALYTVDASPSSPFQVFDFLIPLFYGLQMARLIHHIGMWIVLMFAVVHIYFVIVASVAERIGTFDSIVSGYKFLSKRKAGVP